jgi:hypothetical protein
MDFDHVTNAPGLRLVGTADQQLASLGLQRLGRWPTSRPVRRVRLSPWLLTRQLQRSLLLKLEACISG